MSKTNTIPNTLADLESEHQKLHAEHEAALAALAAKKEAITALRAPVTEWLAERSDLQVKLANAVANRDLLLAGVTRWANWQDENWGGDESAREFLHRAGMAQTDFLAAAGLEQCERFLTRTRAQLDTLNTKLATYCDRHGLSDMISN